MSAEQRKKPDPFATVAVVAVIVLVVAYFVGGCWTCVSLCAGRGETWHWNADGALPPIADACTCASPDGVLRRVPTSTPSPPTGGAT